MDSGHQKKNGASHDAGCSDCGFLNCYRQESRFPDFCPGEIVEDRCSGDDAHRQGQGFRAQPGCSALYQRLPLILICSAYTSVFPAPSDLLIDRS